MAAGPRLVAAGDGPRRAAWGRFARHRPAFVGLVVILGLAAVALVTVFWTPYPIFVQATAAPYSGPSAQHLLGVDAAGRDILSRLMVGVRVSLVVAVGTQFLAVPLGATLGFIAGYWGGLVDSAISLLINVFYGIPGILVALLLVLMLGPGLEKIMIAIAITSWMDMARLARGQTLALREREYVDGARAVGVDGFRIMVRHIMPNAIGPLIVQATYGFSAVILYEAFLSYLGLGVAPPTPSLGSMASEGYDALRIASHMVTAPALTLSVLLIAISFAGDGLRDAFDPSS